MRRLFSGPEIPAWVAVTVIAVSAWTAGLLAARFGWNASPQPEKDVFDLTEIAGLPVPKVAPDLHPEYRALLEEAGKIACRVVESFPADVQAVTALAMAHNLAHNDAGEAACWQRCLELDRNCLTAYSSLAMRAANNGAYQEAEGLLRQAIEIPGGLSRFAELLASVLSDQGKFQEAARTLETALAGAPPTARMHIALGEAYLRLDEFKKSKEQFQKAVQIDRSSTRAYHGLAQASARLGEKQEAEKHRAEMTRLNRLENQARRKQLVEDGDRRGDPTLAPKFAAEILTRAAAVYGAHERKDLAERHLRRAAELCPGDTACRAALAELYGADGRIAEALAVVEELRQIEPQNVSHLKNVGILQGRLGRWEAAQKTFKDLCAIAPDIAVGYAGLAEAYLRAGQELPLARLLAAKAAALEPSAWNFFILGTICERLGDPDAAKSALKKAMALDPGNPRYQQLYSSMKGKD